jgi:hypothetical protein
MCLFVLLYFCLHLPVCWPILEVVVWSTSSWQYIMSLRLFPAIPVAIPASQAYFNFQIAFLYFCLYHVCLTFSLSHRLPFKLLSLSHCVTALFLIVSLSYCRTVSLSHCFISSISYTLAVLVSQYLTVSLFSLSHCLTSSISHWHSAHCRIALLCFLSIV